MTELLYPRTARIKGLQLGLDVKQVQELVVIDGKNFLTDAKGPYSAFGANIVTVNQFNNPELVGTFEVEDQIFNFDSCCVSYYDETSDLFIPVFTYSVNTDAFPWSTAVVGIKHYFCKKGVGVIEYEPDTKIWKILSTDVPPDPVGITESSGRLIILGSDRVAWSAIGDGADLATSPATGAGFQLVIEHTGGGDPYGVFATGDGFITFTSRGIMKSEAINADVSFRHVGLTREFIPINQYTIVDANEMGGIVFLSTQGLYVTRGQLPTPIQPLMSEHLRRNVLPNFNLETAGIIRLTHSHDKQWFIISVAETEQPFLFTKAYVMYIPVDDFGVFNRVHQNLGLFDFKNQNSGFPFGYISEDGFIYAFTDEATVQNVPDLNQDVQFNEAVEIPAYYEDISGTITAIMPDQIYIDVYDPAIFLSGAGLYTFRNGRTFRSPATASSEQENSTAGSPYVMEDDMEMAGGLTLWEPRLLVLDTTHLDSYIIIGTFRLMPEDNDSHFSQMEHLVTHSDSLAIGADLEDWNTFSPETQEDWNVLNGAEDWGEGIGGTQDFDVLAIGTLDGITTWENQEETPEEIETSGGTRHYGVFNAGVYHLVKLIAGSEKQNYHLHLLEASGRLAGRL